MPPLHRRLPSLDTLPNVEVLAFNFNEVLRVVDKCYPLAFGIAIGVALRDELGASSGLIVRVRKCMEVTSHLPMNSNPSERL
ncbi:hypothetical protein [Caldivirga sp. UBA161]|uniref:hypothetical protein n=1 Tax=Caldivirga sp. UBA161 TaxID=1915569 RepID=UPI0025B97BAB|nr:hypothetical protein [Caldivirga sp. UBA161]